MAAAKPNKGKCRIGDQSGLRKLMRAARRRKLPAERLGLIKRAMENAARRPTAFVNAHARKSAA